MAKLDKSPRRNAFNIIAADSVDENKVSILSNNRIANDTSRLLNNSEAVTVKVHKHLIYPNPLNQKYMSKITEQNFQTIKLSLLNEGQMHNLVVLDDGTGKYRLISGEKRWSAFMRMTQEEYNNSFPDGIDTKILKYDTPLDKTDEHILLLTCNVIAFSNSTPDLEQLRDLIHLYLKKGYEKQELVEYLGCYLEDTKQTIYKIIGEAQAIDELYELHEKGVLTRSALQCLGGLGEPEQKKVYEKITTEGIEKVDQTLAFELKKEFKVLKNKRRKKSSDSDKADKSVSFKKYSKSMDEFSSVIEKNEKIKIETMSEMELEYTSSKLENIINKLVAQKAKIDARVNEKKNN